MRKIIQNERRVEMAFEEQRYWDIRRWRIAEEVFAKPLEGLNIQISGGIPPVLSGWFQTFPG